MAVYQFQQQRITTMQALLSPQYSAKMDLFSKQRSPSLRTRRVPSQEQFLCFSNHPKLSKADSPHLSESSRRRKSQYVDSNNLSQGKRKPDPSQQILTSINYLKEEYRSLKDAYKTLIQQKLNAAEETHKAKQENALLRTQLQQEEQARVQAEKEVRQLREELEREKTKVKMLENDLYFMGEGRDCHFAGREMQMSPADLELDSQSQAIPPSTIKGEFHGCSTDSNLLNFSLSSVLQESGESPLPSTRRKQHLKVLSQLGSANIEQSEAKVRRQGNFKKPKKDEKQDKQRSGVIQGISALHLKSPPSSDKKPLKKQSSTSKRRRDEQKENMEVRGKKKSRKLLLNE